MPDKPISPLRQRMIDDMTARRFSEATRKDYVRHVRTFAAFLGRSPEKATRRCPHKPRQSLFARLLALRPRSCTIEQAHRRPSDRHGHRPAASGPTPALRPRP